MPFSVDKLKEMGSRITNEEIQSVLERLNVLPGQTVMDLGAGAGIYTKALARAVTEQGRVYSVDTKKEILDYIESQTKAFKNIRYIEADTPNYNIEKSTIDLIFTRNVLHHLPDVKEYLSRLRDYLKDSGQLVLIDHKKGAKIPGHSDDDFYTVNSVKQLGNETGYSFDQSFDVHKHKLFVILKK